MRNHRGKSDAAGTGALVAALRQPVGEQLVAVLGQDGLGMELDPFNCAVAMPQSHHHAGIGTGSDFKFRRDRGVLNGERVVAGRDEGTRNS